ncbi:MAG: hypothetical protein ABSF64_38825 [Bryobacteraceae bacterium]|jgi:hypothetical protein
MMQRAGVRLIAGTDLPPESRNGSIHDEFAYLAEVILAHRAAGGKNRHRDLIRPVRALQTKTGLLDAGVDRERDAGLKSPDAEHLPAGGQGFAEDPPERAAVRVQILKQAECQRLLHIEIRRAFRVLLGFTISRSSATD